MADGNGFDWRVLLQAVSSALPMLSQARAEQRAFNDLTLGDLERQAAEDKARQRIGDEISAASTSKAEAADRVNRQVQYGRAVREARDPTSTAASSPNFGSAAFREGSSQASKQTAARSKGMVGNFATVDASRRAGQRTTERLNAASTDLGGIARSAQLADFLAQLRASRERVNPWTVLLSQLGSQIANNYQTPAEDLQMRPSIATMMDPLALPQGRRNA